MRQVLAAALVAAVQPGGAVHGEPLDLWRAGVSDAPASPPRPFTLTAALRPSTTPGTTAWLFRPAWNEALARSRDSPHAASREMGLAYSSDGRMSGYMAGRHPYRDASDADACCAHDLASSPATYLNTPGLESPSVAALLGQLKTKGLKLRLDDGWKLDAGARSREYSNSALNSRVGHVTLQRYWGNLVTTYAFQVEKRGGWNVAPSQSLQLGYMASPHSSLAVSYTTGREIAFFGAQGMLKTEVRSLALHGEHAATKNWSFSFDAGYYDHGDLSSQKAVRVAFRRNL
jgi:hypothetical protein